VAGQPNQTLGKSKEDQVESVSDVGGLPGETVGKDVTSEQIRGPGLSTARYVRRWPIIGRQWAGSSFANRQNG